MKNIKKNLSSGTNAGDEESHRFPHTDSDVCAFLRTLDPLFRAEIANAVKSAVLERKYTVPVHPGSRENGR
jgi:hypothetical protein